MKKTAGDLIILHKCTKNHDHVLYCSWDMVHDRCNYFNFGLFLNRLPPNSPKNQNKKKLKNAWRFIIPHMCTKNWDQMIYGSWDLVHDRQTDRQTDGKKWQIEVGAPPKNQA